MSELETLLKKGDVKQAQSVADSRLKSDPNDVEALLVRARVHMAFREVEQAAELITKANELGEPEARLWGAILGDQMGHPDAGRLLEDVCRTATRYEPFFVLGRLLNTQKRFAEARPHLERAVQLDPSQALPHFQLAYALMEIGDVKLGADHLEQTLRLNPLYTPTYLVLTQLLVGNGRPDQAVELLKKGLGLMPGNEKLKAELAKLLPS